jgi:hypothetical protein
MSISSTDKEGSTAAKCDRLSSAQPLTRDEVFVFLALAYLTVEEL